MHVHRDTTYKEIREKQIGKYLEAKTLIQLQCFYGKRILHNASGESYSTHLQQVFMKALKRENPNNSALCSIWTDMTQLKTPIFSILTTGEKVLYIKTKAKEKIK